MAKDKDRKYQSPKFGIYILKRIKRAHHHENVKLKKQGKKTSRMHIDMSPDLFELQQLRIKDSDVR